MTAYDLLADLVAEVNLRGGSNVKKAIGVLLPLSLALAQLANAAGVASASGSELPMILPMIDKGATERPMSPGMREAGLGASDLAQLSHVDRSTSVSPTQQ